MRSLYSGVSGLKVHQTKMDVIGNNISNVNTTGFKSSRVTFNEIFSQTLSGASAPNADTGRAGTNAMQIGLGVNVSSIDTNMTEGAAQRTDIASDLKIEGDGFFIVGDDSGNYFTRAGAFRLDKEGTLATASGLKVYGWGVDAKGEVEKGKVEPIEIMSAENMYSEPAATSNISFEGNLYTGDADDTGESIIKTIAFYDSLGNRYTTDLKFEYGGGTAPATANAWKVTMPVTAPATTPVMYMNGDTTKPIALTAATIPNIVFSPTGKVTSGGSLSLTITTTAGALPVNSTFNPITLDFSKMTQFKEKTTAQPYTKDGLAPGNLTNYSIGTDGIITGTYSNGTKKNFGQIAVATFKNPAGLEKMGNNLFATTSNSGDFDGIGQDPTAGGGKLNAGVLEMSNVDISSEFTDMITTQRGFQANSKIITTSDEMLQTLVNMK
jgi:flagellar hook protein FlgE